MSIINKLENNINRMLEIKIKLIKESNYDHDTFDTEFEKSIDDFFGFIRYTNKLCNHDSETISTKAKELLKLLNPQSIFSAMKRIIMFKTYFEGVHYLSDKIYMPFRVKLSGLLFCIAIENNNLFPETSDERLVNIYQIYIQYLKYCSKATLELGKRFLELGNYNYHPAMYLWKNSTDENDGMILFRNMALFHTLSELIINFNEKDDDHILDLLHMFKPPIQNMFGDIIAHFETNRCPGFENEWSSDSDTSRKWNLPARLRTKKFLRANSKPILAMHLCKQYDINRHNFISQSETYRSNEIYGSEINPRKGGPEEQRKAMKLLSDKRIEHLKIILRNIDESQTKQPELIRLEKSSLKYIGDLSLNHPLNDKESIPGIRQFEQEIYSNYTNEHRLNALHFESRNRFCAFLDISLTNLLRKESDKKRFSGFGMFDSKDNWNLPPREESPKHKAEEILSQYYKTIPLYEKGKQTWSRTNKISRMNIYTRIMFQISVGQNSADRLSKPNNSPIERLIHPIRIVTVGNDVAPNALIINIVLDRFHTLITKIVNARIRNFGNLERFRNYVSIFIGIELCILHFIAHHASPNFVDSNYILNRTIASLRIHNNSTGHAASWVADYPTKRNTGQMEIEGAFIFDSKSDIFVRKCSFGEVKDADSRRIYVESEIDDDRSPQHLFSILKQFCYPMNKWSDLEIDRVDEDDSSDSAVVEWMTRFLQQEEPEWNELCELIEEFKGLYLHESPSYFE
jgi:hypothetical protein